jgi:APA family basic amino acid/polyamine antiporter
VVLSQLLGISRMMFAMARRGDLPHFLKSVDARTGVPHYGVFLSGGIILLFVLFGTLEWVISAAAFTILLYYSIANIAALKMPGEAKLFPDFIAVTGLIFCIILAFSLSISTIISGIILLAIGFGARIIFKKNE